MTTVRASLDMAGTELILRLNLPQAQGKAQPKSLLPISGDLPMEKWSE